MIFGFVIGHNAKAPGAYCPAPLETSEFPFYDKAVDLVIPMAAKLGIEVKKIHRVKGGGYAREIDRAYAQVRDCDATAELHWNYAGPTATGTETLHSGTTGAIKVAKAFHAAQLTAFGLRDRGLKKLSRRARGGRSLHAGKPPACLIEPFFASGLKDRTKAGQLGLQGFANMLLDGLKRFYNLGVNAPSLNQETPKVESPFFIPSDAGASKVIRDGVSKDEFFKQDFSAILAQVNAGAAVPVTREEFILVGYAEAGLIDGKVDNRKAHSEGERGVFPWKRSMPGWDRPMSLESNVRGFIGMLSEYKNGKYYRDYFGKGRKPIQEAYLLAGITHGYLDPGANHGNLDWRVVMAEVAATGDLELLTRVHNAIQYKHAGKDIVPNRFKNFARAQTLI